MKIVVMRHLIDGLKRRLRPRVSRPGRLKELALQGVFQASPDSASAPSTNIAQAIRARFAPLGGVELDLPPREPMGPPPSFE